MGIIKAVTTFARRNILYCGLVVIVILLSVLSPVFLTVGNIFDIILQSSINGIIALVFSVTSEQDVMGQANLLDTVVAKGYNAVAVSPISEQNLLPGLAQGAKKGMKVINVDTATIAQKPYLMGYAAVEAAIMALEGKPVKPMTVTPIKLMLQSDF